MARGACARTTEITRHRSVQSVADEHYGNERHVHRPGREHLRLLQCCAGPGWERRGPRRRIEQGYGRRYCVQSRLNAMCVTGCSSTVERSQLDIWATMVF